MPYAISPYVAFLKAKDGECKGLARISRAASARITPFFDIARPKILQGKEFDGQLERSVKRIALSWGTSRAAYVDLFDIPLSARLASGVHPVTACFRQLAVYGVSAIPVHGFDRDANYLHAISRLPMLDTTGLCIRLIEEEDFDDLDRLLGNVQQVLAALRLNSNQVDIVVDLRSLSGRDPSPLRARLLNGISSLLSIGRFRSVTLAGSNYLRDVSPISKDGEAFVQRTEYRLWTELSNAARAEQFIRFGDYGVVHPDFVELGPVPNANAKIRYALEDSWLVLRGHSLREPPGYAQYRQLSARLMGKDSYRGEKFSWGDRYIRDCARGTVGTGNLGTWVTVDTVHHLEVVSSQVESHIQRARLSITV